jgi:hypothetical protein
MTVSIQRLIGQMESAIKGFSEKLDEQTEDARDYAKKASTDRAQLFAAIDGVKEQISHMDRRIYVVETKVTSITPVTQDFQNLRLKAEGAGWLGRSLWQIGGWVIGAAASLYAAWQFLAGK